MQYFVDCVKQLGRTAKNVITDSRTENVYIAAITGNDVEKSYIYIWQINIQSLDGGILGYVEKRLWRLVK